jgi:hypothetical protein
MLSTENADAKPRKKSKSKALSTAAISEDAIGDRVAHDRHKGEEAAGGGTGDGSEDDPGKIPPTVAQVAPRACMPLGLTAAVSEPGCHDEGTSGVDVVPAGHAAPRAVTWHAAHPNRTLRVASCTT